MQVDFEQVIAARKEVEKFKAMLFDSWRQVRNQTKASQRKSKHISRLRSELSALKEENERLRKDAERLDALDNAVGGFSADCLISGIPPHEAAWHISALGFRAGKGSNIREAIDSLSGGDE